MKPRPQFENIPLAHDSARVVDTKSRGRDVGSEGTEDFQKVNAHPRDQWIFRINETIMSRNETIKWQGLDHLSSLHDPNATSPTCRYHPRVMAEPKDKEEKGTKRRTNKQSHLTRVICNDIFASESTYRCIEYSSLLPSSWRRWHYPGFIG